VWPEDRVARFVSEHFIPARVHVRDQREEFQRLGERFNAYWTPTQLIVEPDGTERHRVEGFLPADDLLAQLTLGLGRAAFARQEWEHAERHFREVVDKYPNTSAAAEALYWAGVARYKGTNDPAALGQTARAFTERYQQTEWAKRSSVWLR
jgi:hypothetical protein